MPPPYFRIISIANSTRPAQLGSPLVSSGWTVTDGTVDLHGAGGSYDVLPGNGSYVDLDGSSFASGLFSNNVNLTGGTTYLLSFFNLSWQSARDPH